MTDNYIFPKINTEYWEVENPDWVAKRSEEWIEIENLYKTCTEKNRKAITILKKYFFEGVLPDFKTVKKQYELEGERYLDLYSLILLHPSSDKAILSELRDQYIDFDEILNFDVQIGFRYLKRAILESSYFIPASCDIPFLFPSAKNTVVFDVMIGDVSSTLIHTSNWECDKLLLRVESFLITMTHILCNPSLQEHNQYCLYQYDNFLEYWYHNCPTDEEYFEKRRPKKRLPNVELALYRIHHFDTEKEGDTVRTVFVNKIRRILDEREFISVFKQMWLDVKYGEIQVKNAFER